MDRRRYEQFLASPLGRWLERQLPNEDFGRPASAELRVLVAALSEDAMVRIAEGKDARDVLELLDLILYRVYGLEPDEVEIAEAYLRGQVVHRVASEALRVANGE